ncbi:MAG: HAD family hydrolase [Kiritimatiellia bacterium]
MNLCYNSRNDFLIAVDSDGCVFDTMEVKQHGHFHPMTIRHWGLEDLKEELCLMADYVNLHSPLRGSNRFLALHRTFELLTGTQAFVRSRKELPWLEPLGEWVRSEPNLHHETLREAAEKDPRLQTVLDWSLAVNRDVAEHMGAVPCFEGVKEALKKLREHADLVVVSLSPHHALQSEWGGAGLLECVDAIAGLDVGGKPHQLALAMEQSGVEPERVLLIGDAPGDLQAARRCGISFYPVLAGEESRCWKKFVEEDVALFFEGTYRGGREAQLVSEFETLLSADPPRGL